MKTVTLVVTATVMDEDEPEYVMSAIDTMLTDCAVLSWTFDVELLGRDPDNEWYDENHSNYLRSVLTACGALNNVAGSEDRGGEDGS